MADESQDAALAVNTSNHVYVKSTEYAWVPARLLETEGTTAKVSIYQYKTEQAIQSDGGRSARRFIKETIDLTEYPNSTLLLQNVDEDGNLNEVEDMVDLPFLHEAAILYNLKMRHVHGKPYTRTGDIVIACNPYQWFHHLYSEEMRSHYANSLVWCSQDTGDGRANLEPHVYEASSMAYRGLAVEGDDQSILVSGESGAGKTETVKILLSDIASVQRRLEDTSDTYESPIVQRVLDSNPLLEAFGNAKTVRNDNSSRFGKYIQLQFEAEDPTKAAYAGRTIPSCVLAGSKCEVYLLEKSRVVAHEEAERTFHIFYQLLAADEAVKMKFWDGLADTDNESFCYVGYTETDTIEGMTDAKRFDKTLESLALVGIKDETLTSLMRVICVVLQLGNLVFGEDPKDEANSTVESEEELDELCRLVNVSKEELSTAFTVRTMFARNEEFKVPLNPVQAKESCDAFAKEIYAKTFLWLVKTINEATCAENNYDGNRKSNFGVIGLLDIFGFESFKVNRFEQLCINYANEKLQQKFTQDIFRSVQAEYEYEGIELGEITYDDNTDVLDLVEGRMGLLAFLNEECVRPGGSDKGFVSKVHKNNEGNPSWIRKRHDADVVFGVRHYAGAVIYDATNFVTKNMDTLSTDLQKCAAKSSISILASEFGTQNTSTSAAPEAKKKKKPPRAALKSTPKVAESAKESSKNVMGQTVWTKFKGQLTSLMTNLTSTRTRYIRCIKPNTMKEPFVMQHISTIEQLRCAGVVAAVTISRSAFPNRLEHAVVIDRFRSLWKPGEQAAAVEATESEDPYNKPRRLVEIMLTSALEELAVEKNGRVMQAFVMGKSRTYFRAGALEYLESERLKKLGFWAKYIQKTARRHAARRRYLKLRGLAIALESLARMRKARVHFLHLRSSAVLLECWYRCILAVRTRVWLNREHKATRIQSKWRMGVQLARFKAWRIASIAIQKIARGAIQRPKYVVALAQYKEDQKLENQVRALQRKLEEAEARRLEAEKEAEEKARKAVEEYSKNAVEEAKDEEKKDEEKITTEVDVAPVVDTAPASKPPAAPTEPETAEVSAEQQALMDESGKMLEYLRKEVFKLRSQNAQMRTDFDLLKDNNQRLMDANASAGASFAALNQHTKQLSRVNDKITNELSGYKQQVQKLSVTQVELKEELKMKQATYVAEVHSRLQYQKAMMKVVDMVQDRCRDSRLVEDILRVADACEGEDTSGSAGPESNSTYASPSKKGTGESSLMSSFRSLWS